MKSVFLFLFLILNFSFASAKMEVLFHPKDNTLEKIADWIQTSSTVDIAMYNMDVTDRSPVIQLFKSPEIQQRLQSGSLKIRMLFEGYSSPEGNAEKMQVLEDLGLDVRFLGIEIKVHHKFAVLDANSENSRVITGSANWSTSSAQNYNENILFLTAESEITSRFQTEFNRLWDNAKEFGKAYPASSTADWIHLDQSDVEVYFNSSRTVGQSIESNNELTAEVIRVIDNATTELQIASTRARLIPILEALLIAAKRGVKISLLLNQDDYRDLYKRAPYLMSHPNLETRIKFYNLKLSDYLAYQMHNKFLIADQSVILTGSFNWSKSSEFNHIENLVEIRGETAKQILPQYIAEFLSLWDLGRQEYEGLLSQLQQQRWTECEIPQMSLTSPQIEELLKIAPLSCQKKPKDEASL